MGSKKKFLFGSMFLKRRYHLKNTNSIGFTFFLFCFLFLSSCQRNNKDKSVTTSVGSNIALRDSIIKIDGMVWIPGGTFIQGALPDDSYALAHEKPGHKVTVNGFYMDIHEVTNTQFSKFVHETGYITVAERIVDWEDLKKQLPKDTPKPHDSILMPGAMTFMKRRSTPPNLADYSQWWNWTIGTNWKNPQGPNSSIEGLEDHPVVQVVYEDALAYCKWAGRRLPTEAEWEYAARANKDDTVFFWGNNAELLENYANTWEGEFPVTNTLKDGFEGSAPVKSYLPNDFGLYDMAGNVWEWTSDWYDVDYYKKLSESHANSIDPKGSEKAYNPRNPYAEEKVIRGGSFLCNASYCASYRISSRMATTPDSSLEHLGFRTVATRDVVRINGK